MSCSGRCGPPAISLRDRCQIAGERFLVFRAADESAVRRALREMGYALPPGGAR